LTFVRTLAESTNVADQFKAFVTFENRFMPNFPGWHQLRRGIGIRPQGVPDTIDYLDRTNLGKLHNTLGKAGKRLWGKIDPTSMHPTYNVMIYLAAALIDFRERSVVDGGEQLHALFTAAPQTIKVIGEMPHLREKFQGVLLRGQVEQGDRDKKLIEPYVWTGGILGVEGEQRAVTYFEHDDFSLEEDELQSEEGQVLEEDRSPSEDDNLGTRDEEVIYDPNDITQRTIDPQDEHDTEVETLLESWRRRFGIDPLEEEDEAQGTNNHDTALGNPDLHQQSYPRTRNYRNGNKTAVGNTTS
jgi:pentatricopeptide repeat-containing protein PET309